MPFVGVSKTFCTGLSSSIDLYASSSTVLMVVSLGNKVLFWLSAFSVMYWSGCFNKKRLCLACFPFNIWIGLECRRILWLVNAVFLLGNCGIQISQSSNMSSHMLGPFPDNEFIILLTIRAIVIHFRGSVFVTLTAMTSLTEVAAVTFEK